MIRIRSNFLSANGKRKSDLDATLCLPVTIGRGVDVDVRVCDRWVSRHHCQIDLANDQLIIRDLDSRHGVFLNGQAVVEAALQVGDRISVGVTNFVVRHFTKTGASQPSVVLRSDGPVEVQRRSPLS